MPGAAVIQSPPTAKPPEVVSETSLQMAPSFGLVGLYLATGILFFVAFCFLLFMSSGDIRGDFFQGKLLGLTHLAVLGWVSMVIFGALFQFIPVVFGTQLASERLAFLQYGLFVPGLLGMVVSFWFFKLGWPLLLSASLVVLSILVLIGNLLATLLKSKSRSLTGLFISTGLFYLTLTASLGFTLAVNLGFPFIVRRDHLDILKIHAHWGMAGWVGMILMGVALKLIPMFALSHSFSTKPAQWAYGFCNAGLAGLALGWWLNSNPILLGVSAIGLAAGVGCYLYQVHLMRRSRLRRLPDLGMKFSFTAFSFLALAVALGLGLRFLHLSDEWREGWVLTYVMAVVLGVFSMVIIGMLYKIVPFLVWFHTFASRVGSGPVPLLKDLFNEKVGKAQYWLMGFSLAVFWAGVLFGQEPLRWTGSLGLLLSALLFGWNMAFIFRWRFSHGNH